MTDNELLLALSDMLDKKLDSKFIPLEQRMTNIEQRTTNIELLLENTIIPRLQNIESCYTTTYNRYQNSVEGYEAMQNDINLLKSVVREHSEKLQHVS